MNNDIIDKNELLNKVRGILKDEGYDNEGIDIEKLILDRLLPSLDELKEIQSPLYEPFYSEGNGTIKKLKGKVIRKIANVTRNTVELSLSRQQKFNDNVSLILSFLVKENQDLKKKLDKLSK